ncbi:hypothetical protein HRbin30_02114 [bacterium HR30]|nr:hypothetical protein HRbin30_02114 [bacterium HR30]
MLAFAGFYRNTEAGQADEPFSSERMAPSELLTHAVEPNGRLDSCRRAGFFHDQHLQWKRIIPGAGSRK